MSSMYCGTASRPLFAITAAVSIAGEASALPRPEAVSPGEVGEPPVLVAGFLDPPKSCSLQTWWHWMDDCVTREGIARDLKAMGEAGIGTAYVFAPKMSNLPTTAKTMSPEWLDLFAFAPSVAVFDVALTSFYTLIPLFPQRFAGQISL